MAKRRQQLARLAAQSRTRRPGALSAKVLLISLGGTASEQIADPLARRGHTVHSVGGLSAATRALADRELIVIDGISSAAVVDACRALRSRVGSELPILAIAASNDVDERIALLEAGADDVLGRPFDARELEALTDALLARRQPSDGPTDSSHEPGPLMGGPGRVITFAAAKGGAGTTTLAVNTALLLAERERAVAIADLDLHHGQVATHLDVSSQESTARLVRDEQLTTDDQVLRRAAARHDSGLHVLVAPSRPDEGTDVTVDDLIDLAAALRRAYPTVIIDAGSVPGRRALALLALADRAIITVTPDIPGLRAVNGMLQAMNDAGVRGEQITFVLNQPYPGEAIERADIERHLDVRLALEVPYDSEHALRAVNEGTPAVLLASRGSFVEALRRLAQLASGEQPSLDRDVQLPERLGRLGGLLRRG